MPHVSICQNNENVKLNLPSSPPPPSSSSSILQALLQQFVDYIQRQKVVLMEDLASHFSLRTQEAISRVQDLQAMGRLTGVIDDRGKFIHISMEEMREVAKFIRQNGRISIADLAAASATLVNLTPQTDLLTLESEA